LRLHTDINDTFPNVGAEGDRVLIRAMLQEPQVSVTRERLDRQFPALFPLIVTIVAILCFIAGDRRSLLDVADYTLARHMPHPSTLLLLVGFSLFAPAKRIYFAVAFVAVHLSMTYLAFARGSYQVTDHISQTSFTFFSLCLNAAFGLTLAYAARKLEPLLSRGPLKPALDVSLSATLLVILLIGGLIASSLGMWAASQWLGYGTRLFEDAIVFAMSEAVVVAVFTPMLLVIAVYPPSAAELAKLAPLLIVFLLLGMLDKALGWQTERVFTVMFAILLRFLLPVVSALPVTLLGLMVQRMVLPDETLNWSEDYLIFASFLTLLTFFDIVLLNQRSRIRRSTTLRQKLSNSYEFSKYGHFLFSARLQRFWMDDMIRIAAQRTFNDTLTDTLRRMPQEDAQTLNRILSGYAPEPQAAIIRIADGNEWADDAPHHVYRLHSVSEMSWQYGLVTIGTLTDITELHETSTTLRETLRQLEFSKERQHRLFALISHELRTPAALLKMLAEQMHDTQDWNQLGPRIDGVLQQFLGLMDDMGSVVRDEDLLPANDSRFNPNEMLAHLINVYRVVAENAGISIDLHSSPKYDADRILDVGRLHQILGNLIRNAILHSQGTHLVISYREQHQHGQLCGVWTVEDNGKGIPQALLPGLFSPFNRKTHGVHSQADGSGLGTYIVKLFVDKMRGTVEYRAVATGGSLFEVTLPLKTAPAEEPKATPLNQPHKVNRTVLLIEDNPLVAEITQSQLLRRFDDVVQVASGEDALDYMRDMTPDLVLTDVELPGMNGVEVCKALRVQGFEGAIFGLTAGATSAEEILAAGAQGILTKPLSMRHFLHDLADLDGWEDLAVLLDGEAIAPTQNVG
jgi:signal transduction histidine kinase/ActR/RegA family two-component response regulator